MDPDLSGEKPFVRKIAAVHIDFADLGRQHGDDKDFPR
jgi:hypothetical protein